MVFPQPSIFFPRLVFKEIGFLEESLDLCMDYDLLLRTSMKYNIYYIHSVLSCIRDYPENKTSVRFFPMIKEVLSVSRRYWGSPWTLKHWTYFIRSRQIIAWAHLKIANEAFCKRQIGAIRNLCYVFIYYPPMAFSRTFISILARTLFGDRVIELIRKIIFS